MRYTISHYAEALIHALEKKSEKERKDIVRRFFIILQKRKIAGRLPRILKELEKRIYARAHTKRVLIEVPAQASEAVKREIKARLGKAAIQEKIRPDLLAGIRIFVDDETLVDASAKRRLDRMFT